MALDLVTLQIASIVSRVAFVSVFLITLLRDPREVYFGLWAGALCCSLTASVASVGDPSALAVTLGKGMIVYTLYGASMALSWGGLRLFYGRPVAPARIAVLTAAPGLLFGGLSVQGATVWALQAVFASIAVSTGLCVAEILRTPARFRLWTQYVVLSGFSGYLTVFLLSIVVVQFAGDRLAAPESGVYSLLVDQFCGVFIQVGYLAMVSERAQVRLGRLAETDSLTGLANRRGLVAALARGAGIGRPVAGAVVLVDIDRFKAINDTHGHESGDRVLVGVAERLRGALRPGDVVARWGGEEFLAVLGTGDAAAAVAVAERLRVAVAGEPFAIDGGALVVTASLGVSVLAADEARIDAAVARADAALYAAKNGGRDRVVLRPPSKPESGGRRADQTAGLRSAVAPIRAAARPHSDFA
ncbi:GGDEF domain-containing protein [Methylobacterium oryzihabitans]|uniref:diguanylate cyclase n=1 Tax=Methylobacterium oryzihabitans TaxID=2499852 RepID=A0A437PHI0_9HYPH|nr:GGDEF domain-containing protein [Methylobacterium oryzihabitans]RVU21677.1 GGDEF domain-containing protein [Methylobacterium oryzihabitans]